MIFFLIYGALGGENLTKRGIMVGVEAIEGMKTMGEVRMGEEED